MRPFSLLLNAFFGVLTIWSLVISSCGGRVEQPDSLPEPPPFKPDGGWSTYILNVDSGPASVLYDKTFEEMGPISNLSYVVITGATFEDCTDQGFPTEAEFDRLGILFSALEKKIDHWSSHHVGEFTHRCQRFGYFYVMDTTGLRDSLELFYADQFPMYKPYINMRPDKDWDTYFKFLVPSPEVANSNSNLEVLMQLMEAGDSLLQPRNVDHWLYFATEKDRNGCKSAAASQGFTTEFSEPSTNSDSKYPFGLRLSRIDHVHLAAIDSLTLQLMDLANKWNGDYDGWETEVVKANR